jgi:hypothetical protein
VISLGEARVIPTPYRFEKELSSEDFQKIGQLSLRWSHTEHIIGSCLKIMLRLSDEEAIVVVFPLTLELRLQRMNELSAINPLPPEAQKAFDELKLIMPGIQYVRNSIVHAIMMPDEREGQVFHLRSKRRSLTKAQVFACEDLTNYAAHIALNLRALWVRKIWRTTTHRPVDPRYQSSFGS